FRLVHAASDHGPKAIPTTETTQEIRQATLPLLARLVAHDRTGLEQTRMHEFALGHPPGGDPLHALRDEPLGPLVPRPKRRAGTVCDTIAPLPTPRHAGTGVRHPLAHLGTQTDQHLALCLCALGTQVVCVDRPEEGLDLLEGDVDAPHPT